MRRIVYGYLSILSLILSVAAGVTLAVTYYFVDKFHLETQLQLSFFTFVFCVFLFLCFFILFVRHCKKAQVKVSLKNLPVDLVEELRALELRHSVYVDNNSSEEDLHIRIEKFVDDVENGGDIENK